MVEEHTIFGSRGGALFCPGGIGLDATLSLCDALVPVEIWSQPAILRSFNDSAVQAQVLANLKEWGPWSALTAIKAFIGSSSADMHSIVEAWIQPPICSSAPTRYWQEIVFGYSLKGACDATTVIMEFFPFLCDRVLPAQLLNHLAQRGWHCWTPPSQSIPAQASRQSHSPSISVVPQEDQWKALFERIVATAPAVEKTTENGVTFVHSAQVRCPDGTRRWLHIAQNGMPVQLVTAMPKGGTRLGTGLKRQSPSRSLAATKRMRR